MEQMEQEQQQMEAKPDFVTWVRGLQERANAPEEQEDERIWLPLGRK